MHVKILFIENMTLKNYIITKHAITSAFMHTKNMVLTQAQEVLYVYNLVKPFFFHRNNLK